MHSFWNILGLDGPTSDLKAIRRGYAKALRITRPDDDPEGFMALREAFERAKDYAAYYGDYDPAAAPMTSKSGTPERDLNARPDLDARPMEASIDNTLDDSLSGNLKEDDDDPITTADYLADALEPAIPALPPIEIEEAPQEAPGKTAEPDQDPVDVIIEEAAALLQSGARNSHKKWERLLACGHNLSLDDYNIYEHRLRRLILDHFGYDDPPPTPRKGLQKLLPKPKPKSKGDMSKGTAIFIFKNLGWNRWKSYPDYIQEELLYVLYELGIKERPKAEKTGRRAVFSEFRSLLKVFGIAVVFALLGNYTEPSDLPAPPRLPDTGEGRYGNYTYSQDEAKWTYQLNNSNEKVKALKPGAVLIDQFEYQVSDTQINKIFITIKGQSEDGPEVTSDTGPSRKIDTDPPGGIHSFFYLIAGIAGLFALFRLFGFVIGLVFGLLGLGLRAIGNLLRRIFGR